MLTLERKRGERIMIDGGIVVTVVNVRDNKVRIGVEAPPGVKIYREEILQQIQARQSAEPGPDA